MFQPWQLDVTQVAPPRMLARLAQWFGAGRTAGRTFAVHASPKVDTVTSNQPAPRFLLWIDAVGGFLVCTASRVVLGQPVPGSDVDIPIQADLSRRHAVIRRDGEGYLIEPLREVRVGGRAIRGVTQLVDGSLIELGDSLQLRFRKPHPLSGTARLEFVSHHRTQPAADAVLLMADSCILGPRSTSHVVCRDWADEVVLFGDGERLACRGKEALEIDGLPVGTKGHMTTSSRVCGADFTFSLEQV